MVQGLERREVTVSELVDALRRGEVLESVLAKILQLELDKLCGRGRDEHLAAVAGGRDAGGTVHVVSDVSLPGHEWRAGVETDANVGPAGPQRLGERSRSGESTGRRRKGEEERVALCRTP